VDIAHIGTDAGGTFVMESGGRRVGELTYTRQDRQVIMNQTWVEPRLRGRGVADTLVKSAVRVARHRDWMVVPDCSYVEYAFEQHPEWSDRLSPGARQDLSVCAMDGREQRRP
jgi:predicted GNAT family acetyltransferase